MKTGRGQDRIRWRASHLNSLIFCKACFATCGLVLSWWKMKTFRVTKVGPNVFKWQKAVEPSIFELLAVDSVVIFGLLSPIDNRASLSTSEGLMERGWSFRLKSTWPNLLNDRLTLRRAGAHLCCLYHLAVRVNNMPMETTGTQG